MNTLRWHVGKASNDLIDFAILDENEKPVAFVILPTGIAWDEAVARAKEAAYLMAAAPQMRDALNLLLVQATSGLKVVPPDVDGSIVTGRVIAAAAAAVAQGTA